MGNWQTIASAQNLNASGGTPLGACSASGAPFWVDGSDKILNRYRALRASLDALHTADAAGGALFAGNATLVLISAEHIGTVVLDGGHMNEIFRTGIDALAACFAFRGVDYGHAVADAYGVKRAGAYAVSQPDTAKFTIDRSARELRCHAAIVCALVIVALFRAVGGTPAAYHRSRL